MCNSEISKLYWSNFKTCPARFVGINSSDQFPITETSPGNPLEFRLLKMGAFL